jgi:hypothetical protein
MYQSDKDVQFTAEGEPVADGNLRIVVTSTEGKVTHTHQMAEIKFYRYEPFGLLVEAPRCRFIYPWHTVVEVIVEKNSDFYVNAVRAWRDGIRTGF